MQNRECCHFYHIQGLTAVSIQANAQLPQVLACQHVWGPTDTHVPSVFRQTAESPQGLRPYVIYAHAQHNLYVCVVQLRKPLYTCIELPLKNGNACPTFSFHVSFRQACAPPLSFLSVNKNSYSGFCFISCGSFWRMVISGKGTYYYGFH